MTDPSERNDPESALDPDGTLARIAGLTRQMDELRAGRYRGEDPAGLAVATVDGDGLVVEISFVRTISRHHPDEVGEAVCASVDAAQRRLAMAFEDLAKRIGAVPADGGTAPWVVGAEEA